MRKMRGRSPKPTRITTVIWAAALVPAALLIFIYMPVLLEITCKTALFSAALAMPDAGLDFFEKRFHDEIYKVAIEDEMHSTVLLPQQTQTKQHNIDAPQMPSTSIAEPTPPQHTEQKPIQVPKVQQEYSAEIISENFARSGGMLIRYGAGHIKNETKYSNGIIEEMLETPLGLSFAADERPQVLIMHTHATESFEKYDTNVYDTRNTWRSTDNHNNMVAVGNVMAEVLESYGIGVLHDTTQHDYPSYNGSYERSAETIKRYLEEYPDIKIVLDLHRDAMARGDAIVKPVVEINGKKAAQIMIISSCDDGTMNMPKWRENLRFAATLQSYMESASPNITRPVYFCYRKYNQDLTTGSLLLEFGSNANTLEEASYSAELAGHALAELIMDYSE